MKKILYIFLAVILFLFFSLSLLFLYVDINEYLKIALTADPKVIANYHFGSEAMVGNGGEQYRTKESYLDAMISNAFKITIFLIIIFFGLRFSLNKLSFSKHFKPIILSSILMVLIFLNIITYIDYLK